jgi:hypothetical protein
MIFPGSNVSNKSDSDSSWDLSLELRHGGKNYDLKKSAAEKKVFKCL